MRVARNVSVVRRDCWWAGFHGVRDKIITLENPSPRILNGAFNLEITPLSHLRALQSQLKTTRAGTWWVLTGALWLHGCTGVSVKGEWQDGVPRNETFSRLFVVGVTPDYNLRCDFESAFASQLRSPSTTVLLSCDSMTEKEQLTRENVERAVASVHADAVLATRLVSAKTREQQGNSWDTRGDSLIKATDSGFGVYGIPITYVELQTAPPLTTLNSSIHVVTKLYETHDATLFYTLDTVVKSQEFDSTEAALITISAPTADRLRRVGLIR